ncbi:MAG TPA: LCP family protein [Anaerolineae bacterium]|nr:LCP family protein [Anaerolineae bacterium]HQI83097.1 LCP family protein [Anaerolineae bacterium]
MRRFTQVLEWLILAALIVLVVVGVQAWGHNHAPQVTVVVTPTVYDSATVPPPTPTSTVTPPADTAMPRPPTWTPTARPTRTPLPTATPTATATPTPASIDLPVAATPVLTTSTMVTSPLEQPTPMPLIEQPKGTINILLLGSDSTGGQIARTDVLLIVSIFPDVPSVSMISIPRDFYAWIPTWGLDKINTAYLRAKTTGYPGGGPALIKATIEYNFGIPIHYYAMVNFDSYRTIVDAVGGVDIVVECGFHDTYPDPESETGQTDIDFEPGVQHLNGKFALWYVRSRWNTSDFDRHRRQQQVLRAILEQALNQNMLTRVPDLWNVYKESVVTDMGLPEMLYLAPVAMKLDMRDIKSRFIRGETLLQSMSVALRGAVLAPHRDALYEFMQEAAQPPVTSRAAQRAYRVEVWNGSGNSSWGEVAAYRLRLEGFEVPAIQQTEDVARTVITDYTTTSKGSPLAKLLTLYRRKQSDVTAEPTEGSQVDFRVTLGWDYNPCAGTGSIGWYPTPTPSPTPTSTP